ncbi:MAG: hypothetical protein Q9192_003472 [Flavoplaca navasiana]
MNVSAESTDIVKLVTIFSTDRFDPTIVRIYKTPASVLEISLCSKALRTEALPVFFVTNSILCTSAGQLSILEVQASHHFTMIRSLTLCISKNGCDTFELMVLERMPALEILAIIIHFNNVHLNREGNLKSARGMNQLRKLRGIKELKLVGTDRKNNGDGFWEYIDVEHPDAVGAWLRVQVTQTRSMSDQ